MELADYKLAARALARLVREEYPSDHSLAECAHVWGGSPAAEVEALERVQAELEEEGSNGGN